MEIFDHLVLEEMGDNISGMNLTQLGQFENKVRRGILNKSIPPDRNHVAVGVLRKIADQKARIAEPAKRAAAAEHEQKITSDIKAAEKLRQQNADDIELQNTHAIHGAEAATRLQIQQYEKRIGEADSPEIKEALQGQIDIMKKKLPGDSDAQ